MPILLKKWPVWVAIAAVILVPGAWLMADKAAPEAGLRATVRRGAFKVNVTTSGELQARKFVQVTMPQGAQQAEAYQIKIASIVPEGTIVKAGDVVADLDRSSLSGKMSEVTLALQKAQAVYEQAMLDSALNLSKAREEIRTMELDLEVKRLAKEQAAFEAPSVKRQTDIDLEKAQRAQAQAKLDYETKTEQAKAKMREVGADLDRQRNKLAIMQTVMAGFTITAPSPGMVIYYKEWSGKKRTTGSQVSPWDPTVATLPDLTQMESVTYVNEIDVRKIAVGQSVTLTLDSDPSKHLTGKVTSVANVGEQRPNTDAKVFEVKVDVLESDTTLRPGMTTGNLVETMTLDSVLSLPLEAVNNEGGVPFVYLAKGGSYSKQEVETGAMNDDAVVITKGIKEGDEVALTAPANRASLAIVRLPDSKVGLPTSGDTAKTATPIPVKPDAKQAAKPALPKPSAAVPARKS
jgi:RND family efflux transporter MFP subunit